MRAAAIAAAAAPLLLLRAASALLIPSSCSATASCTAALNAAIASCGASPCALQLEAGTYLLEGPEYSARIVLSGSRGLTLTGAGDATVLVSNISQVFQLSGTSGVTFASFALEMERLPYTLGQVLSAGAGSSLVQFDATGEYRIELDRHPWLAHAQGVITYDPARDRFGTGSDIYALDSPLAINYTRATGTAAQLRIAAELIVGQWVVIRHQTYSYNGFSVSRCSDTAWRNVTLWTVAGMGIVTDQCTGIDIEGLRIAKKPGRPMSITADGVHFNNPRGGAITIKDSLFEGQGDDGLNAPTIFQFIVALGSDWFQVGGRGTTGAAAPEFSPGDVVNFFNRSSLLPLGQAAVAAIGANNTVQLSPPGVPAGVAVFSASSTTRSSTARRSR